MRHQIDAGSSPMKTHTLRCEMLVYQPIEETFAVFEDAHNLSKLTPSWLNFRVITPGRIKMRRGTEISYRIKWLGLPMHWKTLISAYEAPFLFVDQQEEGPYALWRHRHSFNSTDEGTVVRDQVDYALPFGPLGEVAHRAVVRRQLLSIFHFRQRELSKLFAGKTRQIAAPLISA
jgi:hypothetical protein